MIPLDQCAHDWVTGPYRLVLVPPQEDGEGPYDVLDIDDTVFIDHCKLCGALGLNVKDRRTTGEGEKDVK